MTDKCKTFVARWDNAMCSTCGEEHDRPAPTPTAPPALDLDAVEAAERAMAAGPWAADHGYVTSTAGAVATCIGPDAEHDAAGIVALRNAAPALIAEVRRLRALVDEREGDMHARIRAGYDKTVADAWRAEVAKRDAEIARLTAEHRAILDAEIAESDQAVADLRGEIERLTGELAAARAEVDCGQVGPCAKAPGCARHWQERNRELVAELAAARAVTAGVCRYLDCAESDLLAVVTSLYESRARAISDATAAHGTVGGLLATAPVGSIVEYMDADGSAWHQVEFNATMTAHRLRIASWGSWKQRDMPQRELRQPARLVPAAEADADPSTRGPLPKGG